MINYFTCKLIRGSLLASIAWLVLARSFALHCQAADEVEVWEYSPYKVGLWMLVDPDIDKSSVAVQQLSEEVIDGLERTFAATWRLQPLAIPPHMQSSMERGVARISVSDFSDLDLVLLVDKDNQELKTVRLFETALDQLPSLGMTVGDHQQLTIDTSTPELAQSELAGKLLNKNIEKFDDYESLVVQLKEHRLAGVLVPRMHLPMFSSSTRMIATLLPWHTERFMRDYDKLFLIHCRGDGGQYSVEVRELDCPMRQFGPLVTRQTANWTNVAPLICASTVTAFAPVARIEEANGRLVTMLNRAGGLAVGTNPSVILPGEVLQPMIRREDRRGATTLLEPIPWTYIGVTKAEDGIHLEGTAYSALGNVLQGKQTRRAQRVALRVRPLEDQSDVKVVVRNNTNETQPGCQIYQRDLLTDDMRFLGHTDWRGIITVHRDDILGSLLPEKIKLEQLEAKRQAAAAADKKAAELEAARREAEKKAAEALKEKGGPEEDVRAASPTPSAEAQVVDGKGSVPAMADKAAPIAAPTQNNEALLAAAVQLRQPLVLLYVKSGDTVLARLPLVPGLNEVDIADLPSDAVRLEAEAYFRGFQGEVLDLIGRRAISSSRMTQLLKAEKFEEAEALIREVGQYPDYKSMSDRLNTIHQRMIDEAKAPTALAAKTRIDKMLLNTREILQKHVEKELAPQLRNQLDAARAAKAKADAEAAKAAEAEAAKAEAAKAEAAKGDASK